MRVNSSTKISHAAKTRLHHRNRRLFFEQFEDRRLLAVANDDAYTVGANATLVVSADGAWTNDTYNSSWQTEDWGCVDNEYHEGYNEDVWHDGYNEDVWHDGYLDENDEYHEGFTEQVWHDGYTEYVWHDPYSECHEEGLVQTTHYASGGIVSGPEHGLLSDLDQGAWAFTYTPDEDFVGTDSFTYRIDDDGSTGTATVTITVLSIPTLGEISDPAAINENSGAQTVNLGGISAGPSGSSLSVTATSSQTSLIPNPTVTYVSPNTTGSLSYTPVANHTGTAMITVTVRDAGVDSTLGSPDDGTFVRTFTVTVNPVNDAPTLSAISNPTAINEDAAAQTINLAGISAGGGESQALSVTAVSSNTSLIPNPTVTYASASSTGSLSYTPAANRSGTATITVTVRDAGFDATLGNADDATFVRTFVVTVNPVNDNPTLDVISYPSAVNEDSGSRTVNLAGISAGGGESQALTVTAVSTNATLVPNPTVTYVSGNTTASLAFVPNSNQSGSATIVVTVRDVGLDGVAGNADDAVFTRTFTVTVNAVNDLPTLNAPTNPTPINEDAGVQTVNLSGITAGGESQALTITAVSSNTTLIPNPTVTYTSASSTGSLSYTPVGNQNGTAAITVTVRDVGLDAVAGNADDGTFVRTFIVTINPVNDSPALTGANNLTAIDEDDPNNSGNLVSALLAGMVTDIDSDAVSGIAVTAIVSTNGTWQYSTNGGSTWLSFSSPSASAARLLAANANTRIRFAPNPNWSGSINDGITFRAWDQSSGTAGGTANVSINGGTTAFSSATASAGITVNHSPAVDDQYLIDANATLVVNANGAWSNDSYHASWNTTEWGCVDSEYHPRSSEDVSYGGYTEQVWYDGYTEQVWHDGYNEDVWHDGYWDENDEYQEGYTEQVWHDGYNEDVWHDGYSEDVWHDGYTEQIWHDEYWECHAEGWVPTTHYATGDIISGPSYGTLTVTDQGARAFTYVPYTNFVGTDSFIYSISDDVSEGTATVTINVQGTPEVMSDSAAAIVIADDVTADERNGVVHFRVRLSHHSDSPLTVGFTTLDGGSGAGWANQNVDYILTQGTLTFAPGESVKLVDIPLTNDLDEEPAERFLIHLSNPSSNALVFDSEAIATIDANDSTPMITISDISPLESNGWAAFTLVLSQAYDLPIAVSYSTANGTAMANADYRSSSGTATIASGQTTTTISVPIPDDSSEEPNKTFLLNLTNPTFATLSRSSAQATIVDDDSPTVSITDVSGMEGEDLTFTVSLSKASNQAVTMKYATSDVTATGGFDFTTLASTLLTFAPGQTSKQIVVHTAQDALDENVEVFYINLTDLVSPNNVQFKSAQAVGTILDDDALPALSVADVTVDESQTKATVSVGISPISGRSVTVRLVTGVITAKAGQDYSSSITSVTIPAGQASATIDINLLPDTIHEGDESFIVMLLPTSTATIADNTATVTITDDDPIPAITLDDLTVREDAKTGTLTAHLSNASTSPISVQFVTLSGSAMAGLDFQGTSGMLTFAPGELSKKIEIAILDDTDPDTDESFAVQLFAATEASIERASATVKILDNDFSPLISIDDPQVAEGAGPLTFRVTLSGASTETVSVKYATVDGGTGIGWAHVDADYTAKTGQISFPPGTTSQTIVIPVKDDLLAEGTEKFSLNLSEPVKGRLGKASGRGTILDNDAPNISISSAVIYDTTVTASLTVSLSKPSLVPVSVQWSTLNGTATSPADYIASSGTLQFAANQVTRTITISIRPHVTYFAKSFNVVLSSPVAGAISGFSAGTVTIQHYYAPYVPYSPVYYGSYDDTGTTAEDPTSSPPFDSYTGGSISGTPDESPAGSTGTFYDFGNYVGSSGSWSPPVYGGDYSDPGPNPGTEPASNSSDEDSPQPYVNDPGIMHVGSGSGSGGGASGPGNSLDSYVLNCDYIFEQIANYPYPINTLISSQRARWLTCQTQTTIDYGSSSGHAGSGSGSGHSTTSTTDQSSGNGTGQSSGSSVGTGGHSGNGSASGNGGGTTGNNSTQANTIDDGYSEYATNFFPTSYSPFGYLPTYGAGALSGYVNPVQYQCQWMSVALNETLTTSDMASGYYFNYTWDVGGTHTEFKDVKANRTIRYVEDGDYFKDDGSQYHRLTNVVGSTKNAYYSDGEGRYVVTGRQARTNAMLYDFSSWTGLRAVVDWDEGLVSAKLTIPDPIAFIEGRGGYLVSAQHTWSDAGKRYVPITIWNDRGERVLTATHQSEVLPCDRVNGYASVGNSADILGNNGSSQPVYKAPTPTVPQTWFVAGVSGNIVQGFSLNGFIDDGQWVSNNGAIGDIAISFNKNIDGQDHELQDATGEHSLSYNKDDDFFEDGQGRFDQNVTAPNGQNYYTDGNQRFIKKIPVHLANGGTFIATMYDLSSWTNLTAKAAWGDGKVTDISVTRVNLLGYISGQDSIEVKGSHVYAYGDTGASIHITVYDNEGHVVFSRYRGAMVYWPQTVPFQFERTYDLSGYPGQQIDAPLGSFVGNQSSGALDFNLILVDYGDGSWSTDRHADIQAGTLQSTVISHHTYEHSGIFSGTLWVYRIPSAYRDVVEQAEYMPDFNLYSYAAGSASFPFTASIEYPQPTAVNDAIYTVSHAKTLTTSVRNWPRGVLANDSDPLRTPLTAQLVAGPQHGKLFLAPDGSFTYTPNVSFVGTDTFSYRAYNGFTFSTPAQVSIGVTDATPVAISGTVRVGHDRRTVLDPRTDDLDADGDTLSTIIDSQASHGTLSLRSDGKLEYQPTPGYLGGDSFTYHVTDEIHSSGVATVNLVVKNDAPALVTSSIAHPHDRNLIGTLADYVHDDDDDKLIFGLPYGPVSTAHGRLTLSTDGHFAYIPDPFFQGADNFSFTVSDGVNTTNELITINVQNHAPTARNISVGSIPHSRAKLIDVIATDSDADHDQLRLEIVSPPGKGGVKVLPNGQIEFTPPPFYLGPASFTYRFFDGSLSSSIATVSLTTENHVPEPDSNGQHDSYTTPHDRMLKILAPGVLTNDRDRDQDPLEVHLVESPAHGKFFLHPDGGFVYIPDTGYLSLSEPDHFSYKLWDGIAFSEPVAVTLNVINHAPVAVDDSLSVQRDRPLVDNVLGTFYRTLGADSDAEGDVTTAILVGAPAHGTVTLQSTGEFAYIATSGYTGPDSFTYQLKDGLASSRIAKVWITVNESAPIARNDSYTLAHNATLRLAVQDLAPWWSWQRYQDRYGVNYAGTIINNDQDADFDRLSIRVKSPVKYGTLSFNSDGSIAYAPAPEFHEKDSFTYSVFDGTLESPPATVTFTITNASPVTSASTLSVYHGKTEKWNLNRASVSFGMPGGASDDDGDDLTFELVSPLNDPHLTLTPEGTLGYAAGSDQSGDVKVTYRVSDGLATTNGTATIQISNPPPTAVAVSQAVSHGKSLDLELRNSITNLDNDNLTFTLLDNLNNPNLTFTSAGHLHYASTHFVPEILSLHYSVSDGATASQGTVTINVVNNNPAIHIPFQPIRLGHNALGGGRSWSDAIASDADGDALQIDVTRQGGDIQGTVTLTGNQLRYVPPAGGAGSETFVIRADDGLSGWVDQPITFTVTDVAPAAPPIERSVHFRDELVSSVGNVSWNGRIWTPYPIGTDDDGDTLRAVLATSPSHHAGTFSLTPDGRFTYKPAQGFVGTDLFTYTLTDGRYTSLPATVTIQVKDAVPESIPESAALRTRPNRPISTSVSLIDNDTLDAAYLNIQVVQSPIHGTLSYDLENHKFTYQPTSGFVGLDTFSYVATDGQRSSDPIRVNVAVSNNTTPKAQNDRFFMRHDHELLVTAKSMSEWSVISSSMDKEKLGNYSLILNDLDNDGDTLHVELVDGPTKGTLALEDDGSFSYVAGPDFFGDWFTYRVSDGESFSAPATVWIEMSSNTDPVVADDVYRVSSNGVLDVAPIGYAVVINGPQAGRTIRFDEPVHFGEASLAAYMGLTRDPSLMAKLTDRTDVLRNDFDGDVEALRAELGSDVQHGTLQFYQDGTFTYTPHSGYYGDDAFTYRASDGRAWSDFATVTIHVQNTAPHAADIEYTTPHNKALLIESGSWAAAGLGQSLAKAVTDDERQSLTIEKLSEPAHGTLNLSADGGFTYTPIEGFVGVDSFLFSASDGLETSNIAVATIRVTNARPAVPLSNESKVIRNQSLTAILPTATDPDGDTLVPELITAPRHGALAWNGDGTFTYTPAANFLGADVVAMTYSDGAAQGGFMVWTFSVEAHAPVAMNDNVRLFALDNASNASGSSVLANDTDADGRPLTAAVVKYPIHGVLNFQSDGTFTYTPHPGYLGTDNFAYKANDGWSDSLPATVTITVQPAAIAFNSSTFSERAAFSGTLGTFQHVSTAETVTTLSATVAWGDGSRSPATIVAATGGFQLQGSHTYARPGSYSMSTEVRDSKGIVSVGTRTIVVADQPLSITPTARTAIKNVMTASFSVATFQDGNGYRADQYSATINWGDGTTSPASIQSSNIWNGDTLNTVYDVRGMHRYLHDGVYTTTVSITPEGGAAISAHGSVTVSHQVIVHGTPVAVDLNGNVDGYVATFTSNNPDSIAEEFLAFINWGDGTSSLGTVDGTSGNFAVYGQHSYVMEGDYAVNVVVTDDDPDTSSATYSANTSTENYLRWQGNILKQVEDDDPGTQTLVTFTDPGQTNQNPQYTASIRWGDGKSSTGTVVSDGNGKYHVEGSHTYKEEDAYKMTVEISDQDGLRGTTNASALVVGKKLTASGVTVNFSPPPSKGKTWSGVIATFTDESDPSAKAGDYTAEIDWNDGTAATAEIVKQGGTYQIKSSRTFDKNGTQTARIFIYEGKRSRESATSTFNINIPSNDNSTNNNSSGLPIKDISVPGCPNMFVPATDGSQNPQQNQNTVTIADATVIVRSKTVKDTGLLVAQQSYSTLTVGTYQGDLSNFTAKINWGDGTGETDGTLNGSEVTGSHTYDKIGVYEITSTIKNTNSADSGLADSRAFTITTGVLVDGSNFALSASGGGMTVNVGDSVSADQLASISGNGEQTIGLIEWGDGSVTPLSISQGSISGSHAYSIGGDYIARLIVKEGTHLKTATHNVHVNADPGTTSLSYAAQAVSATERDTFTNVVLATVTDPAFVNNGVDWHEATVDWGDGVKTEGVVRPGTGNHQFEIVGSHRYSDAGARGIHISYVTAHVDPDTGEVTGDDVDWGQTINVVAPAISFSSGFSGTTKAARTVDNALLAKFTVASTELPARARDFRATIDWGDGSREGVDMNAESDRHIVGSGTEFYVYGSHEYALQGDYKVTLIVTDGAAATQRVMTERDVSVVDAATGIKVDFKPVAVKVEETKPDGTKVTPSAPKATINWDDGTSSAGTVDSKGNGIFVVGGQHRYLTPGFKTITVNVKDQSFTRQIYVTPGQLQFTDNADLFTTPAEEHKNLPLAVFSSSNFSESASSLSAIIDWGDGRQTAGLVIGNLDKTFTVSAGSTVHNYAEIGHYPIAAILTSPARNFVIPLKGVVTEVGPAIYRITPVPANGPPLNSSAPTVDAEKIHAPPRPAPLGLGNWVVNQITVSPPGPYGHVEIKWKSTQFGQFNAGSTAVVATQNLHVGYLDSTTGWVEFPDLSGTSLSRATLSSLRLAAARVGYLVDPDQLKDIINGVRSPYNVVGNSNNVGLFIDGTGNSLESQTNVAHLYNAYTGTKFYYGGVGNPTDTPEFKGEDLIARGNMFGAGWDTILDRAVSDIANYTQGGGKSIDVFGFSRGAAMANELTKRLDLLGIHVRFLGMFDPVYSKGAPGQSSEIVESSDTGSWNNFVTTNIPDNVGNASVIYAAHEERVFFPYTRFTLDSPQTILTMYKVPGNHGEAGGHWQSNQPSQKAAMFIMKTLAERAVGSNLFTDGSVVDPDLAAFASSNYAKARINFLGYGTGDEQFQMALWMSEFGGIQSLFKFLSPAEYQDLISNSNRDFWSPTAYGWTVQSLSMPNFAGYLYNPPTSAGSPTVSVEIGRQQIWAHNPRIFRGKDAKWGTDPIILRPGALYGAGDALEPLFRLRSGKDGGGWRE